MARLALSALLALSIGITVAFSTPGTALGQPQCGVREVVLDTLARKYEEFPTFMGVTHNGGMIEILTTEGGQTWSIIVTTPDGISCLVAAGEGWQRLNEPQRGQKM